MPLQALIKVSEADLIKIEALANEKVLECIDVKIEEMPIEQARESGKIKMFFGDKYGDIVRAVTMDDKYSIELCGGTHVKNTSEIGLIKIISESSIAAGVRRIEAVTGRGVLKYIESLENKIESSKHQAEDLHNQIRGLEKEIAKMKQDSLSSGSEAWVKNSKLIGDIRIIAEIIPAEDLDALRNIGEKLRDELKTNSIALLAAVIGDKAQLCCVVTDDIKGKYPAGKLVGEAAKVLGGGGGGKPHLATAGGKDISKLEELVSNFVSIAAKF